MDDMILYTLPGCGKCKVLKDKMSSKGIKFQEVSEIGELFKNDIDEVPVLKIGETQLDFVKANDWVNQQ